MAACAPIPPPQKTELPRYAVPQTFLCREDQLEEGRALGFDPWGEGRDTVLALLWRGQVRVYRNLCPHLDVAMQYRKDRFMSGDGQHIVCFAHGALFQPDNGFCVLGPCLGQSLQALTVQADAAGGMWLEESGALVADGARPCVSMAST
ncbi:Rieske (2Fe-2S) protein [Pseudomonas sp. BN411]|nr:Rieske (2Fe-2S) protein [Pseudomonas sp. BN411]